MKTDNAMQLKAKINSKAKAILASLLVKEIEVNKSLSRFRFKKSSSTSHKLFTDNMGLNDTSQENYVLIKLPFLK